MSKIWTIADISPARLSRSLSQLLGKWNSRPETMEHTCSECLRCGEIILRPVTKITNILMVFWEKGYLERSEKASKEKAYR